MAFFQELSSVGLDAFPAAPFTPRQDVQSDEGRKIKLLDLDSTRSWQERGEALLAQKGPMVLITGRSLGDGSEQDQPVPQEPQGGRRIDLINKKFHCPEGLTAGEDEELRQLQAEFEAELDSIRPLPYQMLDELEALADQLKAKDEQS